MLTKTVARIDYSGRILKAPAKSSKQRSVRGSKQQQDEPEPESYPKKEKNKKRRHQRTATASATKHDNRHRVRTRSGTSATMTTRTDTKQQRRKEKKKKKKKPASATSLISMESDVLDSTGGFDIYDSTCSLTMAETKPPSSSSTTEFCFSLGKNWNFDEYIDQDDVEEGEVVFEKGGSTSHSGLRRFRLSSSKHRENSDPNICHETSNNSNSNNNTERSRSKSNSKSRRTCSSSKKNKKTKKKKNKKSDASSIDEEISVTISKRSRKSTATSFSSVAKTIDDEDGSKRSKKTSAASKKKKKTKTKAPKSTNSISNSTKTTKKKDKKKKDKKKRSRSETPSADETSVSVSNHSEAVSAPLHHESEELPVEEESSNISNPKKSTKKKTKTKTEAKTKTKKEKSRRSSRRTDHYDDDTEKTPVVLHEEERPDSPPRTPPSPRRMRCVELMKSANYKLRNLSLRGISSSLKNLSPNREKRATTSNATASNEEPRFSPGVESSSGGGVDDRATRSSPSPRRKRWLRLVDFSQECLRNLKGKEEREEDSERTRDDQRPATTATASLGYCPLGGGSFSPGLASIPDDEVDDENENDCDYNDDYCGETSSGLPVMPSLRSSEGSSSDGDTSPDLDEEIQSRKFEYEDHAPTTRRYDEAEGEEDTLERLGYEEHAPTTSYYEESEEEDEEDEEAMRKRLGYEEHTPTESYDDFYVVPEEDDEDVDEDEEDDIFEQLGYYEHIPTTNCYDDYDDEEEDSTEGYNDFESEEFAYEGVVPSMNTRKEEETKIESLGYEDHAPTKTTRTYNNEQDEEDEIKSEESSEDDDVRRHLAKDSLHLRAHFRKSKSRRNSRRNSMELSQKRLSKRHLMADMVEDEIVEVSSIRTRSTVAETVFDDESTKASGCGGGTAASSGGNNNRVRFDPVVSVVTTLSLDDMSPLEMHNYWTSDDEAYLTADVLDMLTKRWEEKQRSREQEEEEEDDRVEEEKDQQQQQRSIDPVKPRPNSSPVKPQHYLGRQYKIRLRDSRGALSP